MDNTQTIAVTCESSFIVNLDELHDLHHFKRLEDTDYAKCRNSLTDPDIGFSFPLSIWRDPEGKLFVVDGHMRVRTLRRMKEEGFTIPLLPATLIHAPSKQKAAKKIVASDSKYGTPIEQDFVEFLQEYDITPEEIEPFMEIPGINSELWTGADMVEEDEPPEVNETEPAVSQLGEVYQLGRHRLLCGDATKIEDVEKLMNGQKADMVFTDPPYGIDIVKGNNIGGRGETHFGSVGGEKIVPVNQYAPIINDDTTQTAKDAYSLCISLGIEKLIFWGGNYFTDFLTPSPCWLIWNKKNTGNFADVEIAWTNFKSGARLYDYLWNGLSREGDRASELISRVHPTQKPVGLHVNILRDYSENNNIILDLFGGSGSTLIACEQTNRSCYMSELDGRYSDVIMKRFINFTKGQQSVIRLSDGKDLREELNVIQSVNDENKEKPQMSDMPEDLLSA